MKIVVLVEGMGIFEEMIKATGGIKSTLIDTKNCDELHEFSYILTNIDSFSQSDSQIMLISFSGKESIIKNIGEECPDMIICFSENLKSKYYTEFPTKTLLDLINKIKKGDY